MPGTLLRELTLTASTGRPPRCVTKSSCRCSRMPLLRTSCSSRSATRCRPVRSSPRSFRSFGEALSLRSEPSCSTARSIASASGFSAGSIAAASSAQQRRLLLLERRPSAQRPGDGVADVPQRRGGQNTAERSVRRRVADVADPFERRFRRVVEQCDRLGSERLAPRPPRPCPPRASTHRPARLRDRWRRPRRPAAGSRGTRARREPAVPPPECRPDMVERHALAPPDHGRRLPRRGRGGKRGRRWRAAPSRRDGLRADAGAPP